MIPETKKHLIELLFWICMLATSLVASWRFRL
jgi:hypothetical protein